jgi:hypothetical protein
VWVSAGGPPGVRIVTGPVMRRPGLGVAVGCSAVHATGRRVWDSWLRSTATLTPDANGREPRRDAHGGQIRLATPHQARRAPYEVAAHGSGTSPPDSGRCPPVPPRPRQALAPAARTPRGRRPDRGGEDLWDSKTLSRALSWAFYAACSYSLISPPRMRRRLTLYRARTRRTGCEMESDRVEA